MKLTREGIKEREAWEKAGINLPGYDVHTWEVALYCASGKARR